MAALLFICPLAAVAAEDFDSEFRQLEGMIVSGDFDTEGNLCLELGDGTSVCISASDLEDIVAGSGLWVYDGGAGTLSPVIPSSDAVLLEGTGSALLVDGGSAGGSTSASIAVTTTGDSKGIRVIQEDGPAIYLTGVGTAAGAQAWFEENSSAPPTPGTAEWALYFKSDGLYVMDDAGVETGPLGTGGGGGGGSMDDFTVDADTGTGEVIADANTLNILGDADGIDTTVSSVDTVTISLDFTEVDVDDFDEMDPLTTKGDILVNDGSDSIRLAVSGSDLVPLQSDSSAASGLKWAPILLSSSTSVTGQLAEANGGSGTTGVYNQTLEEDGTPVTQRDNVDFIGRAVTVSDDGAETEVAILDDYTLSVQALTSAPTDAQTVYFGQLPKAPTTTANISRVYIRESGTIVAANIFTYSGTAGSNENWSLYIRLNNTTDTLIETIGANTNERTFDNSSLSISVTAGDYIEIKGVQPTWGTNPNTTIYGGYLLIRR